MAAVDSLGPFGKLPPEIRNRIYELVVPAKSVVKLHAVKRSDVVRIEPRQPALITTSRGLRAETLSLYYSSNVFKFCHSTLAPDSWAKFEARRGPGFPHLKEIHLSYLSPLDIAHKPERLSVNRSTGSFYVRFKAKSIESGIMISELQSSGSVKSTSGGRQYPPRVDDNLSCHLCCCFLQMLCGGHASDHGLMDLVTSYVHFIKGGVKHAAGVCKSCGGLILET